MLYTYYFSKEQFEITEETSSGRSSLPMYETFVNGMHYSEKIQQSSKSTSNWDDAKVVFEDTEENVGVVTFGSLL